SMHFLPKRVADISGRKWGLTSDSSHEVTQTPDEFLSFFRKQPSESQDNGVWIVMTDPNAYGELERKFFSDVQDLCRREKILLFVARVLICRTAGNDPSSPMHLQASTMS